MPDLRASTPDALAVVTEKVWTSRRKHRDDQVAPVHGCAPAIVVSPLTSGACGVSHPYDVRGDG
jgi:hypothetical protein